MANQIKMTVTGADRVIANLRVLGDKMPEAAGRALYRFVEKEIATPAKQDFVPVMFGALRSSIHVTSPIVTERSARVEVVAGGSAAPYARMVHENPRSGRTGGVSPRGKRYKNYARVGQWKYLETPAVQAVSTKLPSFAKEAGAELDEVIRGLRG